MALFRPVNAQYSRARARKVAQVSQSLAETGDGPQRPALDLGRHRREGRPAGGGLGHFGDVEHLRRASDVHRGVRHGICAVDGQCGAVFLLEGIPVGLDLFENDAVLRKLMPKLLRSHALDALDELDARAPKNIGLFDPRDTAKTFITAVAKAAQDNARLFPTVGLGQTMRVDDRAVAAAALLVDSAVFIWRRSTWVTHEESGQDPRISDEH